MNYEVYIDQPVNLYTGEYITNNKVKSLVDTTTFTQVNKETGRIHHKQYNDTTTFTQVHQEAGRVHDKW